LEEVDSIFLDSKNIFDTVAVARKLPPPSAVRRLEKAAAKIRMGEHVEQPKTEESGQHLESDV
jgi:hypothetical protein